MGKTRSILSDVVAAAPFALLWGWLAGSQALGLTIMTAGVGVGVGRVISKRLSAPFLERMLGMLVGSMAAALIQLYVIVR